MYAFVRNGATGDGLRNLIGVRVFCYPAFRRRAISMGMEEEKGIMMEEQTFKDCVTSYISDILDHEWT